jgi:hypothetical protein
MVSNPAQPGDIWEGIVSKLFTMYIGLAKDKEGHAIEQQERELAIHLLKDKLANDFGGYSVGEVNGGYRMAETGALVEEPALRVEVTASDAQMQEVRECATMFRDLFRQESVLVNCTTVDSAFI